MFRLAFGANLHYCRRWMFPSWKHEHVDLKMRKTCCCYADALSNSLLRILLAEILLSGSNSIGLNLYHLCRLCNGLLQLRQGWGLEKCKTQSCLEASVLFRDLRLFIKQCRSRHEIQVVIQDALGQIKQCLSCFHWRHEASWLLRIECYHLFFILDWFCVDSSWLQ